MKRKPRPDEFVSGEKEEEEAGVGPDLWGGLVVADFWDLINGLYIQNIGTRTLPQKTHEYIRTQRAFMRFVKDDTKPVDPK